MISARSVTAVVENDAVAISYYAGDGRISLTINGATCQFPAYQGSKISIENTIAALKEAASKL